MSIRNILNEAKEKIKVRDIEINNEGEDNHIPSLFDGLLEISNKISALEIANPSGWYGFMDTHFTMSNYVSGAIEQNIVVRYYDTVEDELVDIINDDVDIITNPTHQSTVAIEDRVIGNYYPIYISIETYDGSGVITSRSFSENEIKDLGSETINSVLYYKYLIPYTLNANNISYNVTVDGGQGFGGDVIVNWTGTSNEPTIGAIEFSFEGDDGSYQNRTTINGLTIGTPSVATGISPALPINKHLLIFIDELYLYNVISLLCSNTSVIFNGIINIPALPSTSMFSYTIPPSLNTATLTFNLITST